MSYDDDEAYDANEDWRIAAAVNRRLAVDKDYLTVTRHNPFYIFKNSPVELFSVVCKNLVAGMKIAVKIKDDNLTTRFWIVDALEALANLYVGKGQTITVSPADSQKMAEAFKPAIPLFKEWISGRPKLEDKVDFQTGYKPRSFAGELDHHFVWLYDRLREKGHNMVSAVHPILFMPASMEEGGENAYSFMSGKFQTLLTHCAIYRERHTITTEIDKMFAAEMKKPAEERFFNLDDEYDDGLYEDGSDTAATERSRLKAYLHYRQEAYNLHTTRIGGLRNGFEYVRDDLAKRLKDAKNAAPRATYGAKYSDFLELARLGKGEKLHTWFDLLYDVLRMRTWISYRDFCVDSFEDTEKTLEAGYHDDDGWPYFDVDENIPEHDICIEVRRTFAEYLETLTALSFCVQSTVYPRLAGALELYESHGSVFLAFDKKGHLKAVLDTIKDTASRLSMEVRLYKSGKAILAPFDKAAEELKARLADHDKKTDSVFDAAQRDSAEILAQERENQELLNSTADKVNLGLTMIGKLKRHGDPGEPFSFEDQKKCFEFWIVDRKNPMLVDGHKVLKIDSFKNRERELERIRVKDVDTYIRLIECYRKRTGATIPNTKRKLEKKRKAEERNRKRKTASKKRKSTPGKRNKK